MVVDEIWVQTIISLYLRWHSFKRQARSVREITGKIECKREMKPGKNDIKAEVKFEIDELELLQENTWQMAESFGLDRRIANLTGKRKVGFYSWDLDCLECVVSDLQKSSKDKEVADRIARKIEESYMFIKGKLND